MMSGASCEAIRNMTVRGAGAIGAVAGYAMAQAFLQAPDSHLESFVAQARLDIESTLPQPVTFLCGRTRF